MMDSNRNDYFSLILIRVWKVSFDFQFKYKVNIEKIEHFDFCLNIEYWILRLVRNFAYQILDLK